MEEIIIIGAPRSGTTLLSGLITGNEVCYPNFPECTFMTQIIEHYYNIVHYSDNERFRVYAQNPDVVKSIYISHLNNMKSIVTNQFKQENYKYLIFKDPELTLYIDLIPDFFNQSHKIIYIVRNPINIIYSMLKVELKKEKHVNRSNFYLINKFKEDQLINEISKKIYNYFYIAHNSNVYKNDNLCVIEYENIINGDNSEFSKLETFLGYQITRKAFERNYYIFDQNDPTFSKNYGKDIINTESDSQDKLSKKSLKLIKEMFSGFNTIYKWW